MGWLATLRGKVVGLDTTLLCFIEENPTYLGITHPFLCATQRSSNFAR